MNLTERDRRALLLLGAAAILATSYWLVRGRGATVAGQPAATAESVQQAEQRLAKVKQLAAAVPARQAVLQKSNNELATREKGLIVADTPAQAQAQLVSTLRRVAKAQTPPLAIRGQEYGPVRALGNNYGEAIVTVAFDCRIDQLVNFLADLTAQTEIIATDEERLGAASPKEKIMPVRLTVAGLVPKRLVPDKKGPALF